MKNEKKVKLYMKKIILKNKKIILYKQTMSQ